MNRGKFLSGLAALTIYLGLIFLILFFYNIHKTKAKNYVEKNDNRVTVTLVNSEKTVFNKSDTKSTKVKPTPTVIPPLLARKATAKKVIAKPPRKVIPKPPKKIVPKRVVPRKAKKIIPKRPKKVVPKKIIPKKPKKIIPKKPKKIIPKKPKKIIPKKPKKIIPKKPKKIIPKKPKKIIPKKPKKIIPKKPKKIIPKKPKKIIPKKPKKIIPKKPKKIIPKKPKKIIPKKPKKIIPKKPKKIIPKKPKKIIPKKPKKIIPKKPKKIIPKKPKKSAKDLFSSVKTKDVKKRPAKKAPKHTSRPKSPSRIKHNSSMTDRIKATHQSGRASNANRDSGVKNAYIARVKRHMNNWNAGSSHKGQRVTIKLTIFNSGKFRYTIVSGASGSMRSSLVQYLKRLNSMGLGRHKKSTPYTIRVSFTVR